MVSLRRWFMIFKTRHLCTQCLRYNCDLQFLPAVMTNNSIPAQVWRCSVYLLRLWPEADIAIWHGLVAGFTVRGFTNIWTKNIHISMTVYKAEVKIGPTQKCCLLISPHNCSSTVVSNHHQSLNWDGRWGCTNRFFSPQLSSMRLVYVQSLIYPATYF